MESNEEKLRLGYGSFFTEDSFLLSDYLHRQAERAGNRLFNNKNSLLFLRSKIFSLDFEQKEGEKIMDPCRPSVLKSVAMGSTSAQKENSESFNGKECSSHIVSGLEQQKRESSASHKSLASSDSCIDSSQCCESEEAAVRIDTTKGESLHNNLPCCESREAISMTSSETEDEEEGFPSVGKHDTEALDLLAFAAMQDNPSDACHDAALHPLTRVLSPFECQVGASPVHGGSSLSPILKKRVIRRAKSAFQKQLSSDATTRRLKFFESVTGKEIHALEWCMQGQRSEPVRHEVRVAPAKRRKLQDICAVPLHASAKADSNEGKDLQENCGVDKDRISGCLNEVSIGDFSKYTQSKGGVSHLLHSKLPSSFSMGIPESAHRFGENCGNVPNYRKLQVSCSRLLDACDAKHSNGACIENTQLRIAAEASTSNNNCLTPAASKGVSKACLEALERDDGNSSFERGKGAEFTMTTSGDMKHGSLRLRILPIRQPSADGTSLPDVSKMKGSEFVTEGRMVTRKRRLQDRMEKERTCTSTMGFSPRMPQMAIQMADTRTINTDPVMRTKRGRSQVMPTKYSDSVLQPLKSLRRKISISNA